MKRGVSSETMAKNLLESALIEIEREMGSDAAKVPVELRGAWRTEIEVGDTVRVMVTHTVGEDLRFRGKYGKVMAIENGTGVIDASMADVPENQAQSFIPAEFVARFDLKDLAFVSRLDQIKDHCKIPMGAGTKI
jgi:hypothetical protein